MPAPCRWPSTSPRPAAATPWPTRMKPVNSAAFAAGTRVLVTGATGFLGEHLCRILVERGHTVRGLARTRSAILADLGVEHVRGDVLAGPELDQALDGVAAVFHLAGAVSRDPDDAQRMMRL